MFEDLFVKKYAIQRQRNGLFASERESYLRHCQQIGSTRITLQVKGQALLRFASHMRVSDQEGVSKCRYEELIRSVTSLNPTPGAIYSVNKYTRPWLQYLGWWLESKPPKFNSDALDDFVCWMRNDRGLSRSTVMQWTERVRSFLEWYARKDKPLSDIGIYDIDEYFIDNVGRWGRASSAYMVTMLRVFLRHAASIGRCDRRLPELINRPRMYALEGLPAALDWQDVKRLLSDADTESGRDIRDRACMMLMSIYGLRRCEVAALRLDQIDFNQSRLMVQRAKNRAPNIYPLVPSVATALSRYIDNWRPAVKCPEVFIRCRAPLVPISPTGLSTTVHRRIKKLGATVARSGPHALRHACAVKLLSDGITLKEIGDHLGHKSTSATRVYAKTNLQALREVAEFDLGDLT
jgi:integrase/recombinase XerD